VKGGVGYAYEFGGPAIEALSMEERMTLCNMAIEGGARCGYVNPDAVTYAYLQGRPHAPSGQAWDRAVAWWSSLASGPEAVYDDIVHFDAATIAPTVTWGITPGQGIGIDEAVPTPEQLDPEERPIAAEAYRYMDLTPGASLDGLPIDVCFIGSCTNGRLSDLRAAAAIARGRHVAPGHQGLCGARIRTGGRPLRLRGSTPSSRRQAFEWREPGCSMCLAMNPDRLEGRQISASSSNRNFKGRQGSASGRTLLMSPAMVAAAAVNGHLSDVPLESSPRCWVRFGRASAQSIPPGAAAMTAPFPSGPILRLQGRGVVVEGDDIDTDRIIPARFLKCVSFEGLADGVFADDRAELAGAHPFDRPEFQGATLLVVNRNFGCGSSREHAPQALMRWGIRAVIGESFAEIFFGNCLALGIPCLTASHADCLSLQASITASPGVPLVVDLERLEVPSAKPGKRGGHRQRPGGSVAPDPGGRPPPHAPERSMGWHLPAGGPRR
jgi:3-isopropylmalate dehydratase small subunit